MPLLLWVASVLRYPGLSLAQGLCSALGLWATLLQTLEGKEPFPSGFLVLFQFRCANSEGLDLGVT